MEVGAGQEHTMMEETCNSTQHARNDLAEQLLALLFGAVCNIAAGEDPNQDDATDADLERMERVYPKNIRDYQYIASGRRPGSPNRRYTTNNMKTLLLSPPYFLNQHF